MKIDKQKLWNILEKYDSNNYTTLCDGLSNIIQEKNNSNDLIAVFTYLEKINQDDRNTIENQIGNEITAALYNL